MPLTGSKKWLLKMAKLPQSRDELFKHLSQQLRFLRNSCKLFDEGDIAEAKRLGVTLRLLLHNTKHSNSLLKQLNKQKIRFYDSARDRNPRDLIKFHYALVGLKMVRSNSGDYLQSSYVARCSEIPVEKSRLVLFEKWWNKIVIIDSKGNTFSRKEIILAVVNTDGGAHVDPELEESYAELKLSDSTGWAICFEGKDFTMHEVELHSIRQIAEEVLESLKLNSPKLFQITTG